MGDLNKEKEVDKLVENQLKIKKNFFEKNEEKDGKKNYIHPATSIVEELFRQGMLVTASEDPDVQERILKQARESIITELSKTDNRGKKQAQDAAYDANEESCKNYGVDNSVEQWKILMMKFGSGFWFILYFIIATFTLAPISVFTRGINTFIKRSWASIILAILVYLFFTVGIPLLIKNNLI